MDCLTRSVSRYDPVSMKVLMLSGIPPTTRYCLKQSLSLPCKGTGKSSPVRGREGRVWNPPFYGWILLLYFSLCPLSLCGESSFIFPDNPLCGGSGNEAMCRVRPGISENVVMTSCILLTHYLLLTTDSFLHRGCAVKMWWYIRKIIAPAPAPPIFKKTSIS